MTNKITLNNIASGFNLANINANFQAIQAYINDRVLSRTTETGDANQMNNDLDMNSYRIINTTTPSSGTEAANKQYVDNRIPIDSTLTINTLQESFIATAGQTVFTLSTDTYTPGSLNLDVYINGVHQDTSDYTETSETVITFGEGLEAGDKVLLKINQRVASNESLVTANVIAALANGDIAPGDVTFNISGSGLKTGTTAGNTLLLQAYDVGAGSYKTLGTLSAHATDPTFDLDADVTIDGNNIISLETANAILKGNDADGVFSLVPLTDATTGGVIQLYGGSHSSRADDIALLSDGTEVFNYDNSADEFQFNSPVNLDGDLIMSSGSGIDFSASADGSGTTSSEVLDDYEVGTFTPTMETSSGSGTITYNIQEGEYTKIGNVVYISVYVSVSSLASRTGSMYVSGLPFTSAVTDDGSSMSVGYASGLSITAGESISGTIDQSSTRFYLYVWDLTTGMSTMNVASHSASNPTLQFSGVYRV